MGIKFSLGDGSALKNANKKRKLNLEVFTIVAPRYALITRILSFGQDQRWKREMTQSLSKKPVQLSVDLACGTGDLSRLTARFSKQVIAVDICPEMLKFAKKQNTPENLHYIIADMQALPLIDNSVDIITGGYALRNAPDLEVLLKNLFQKLKPGGQALFLDFSRPANPLKASLQAKLLNFWTRFWGLMLHRNSDVYGYIVESLALFPNIEDLKALILATGFNQLSCREYLGGFTAFIQFSKPQETAV